MTRNKFRQYGKKHWEENRTHRNKVVSLRKKSIATYFSKYCSKHDKSFWSTVSPFISDKNKSADSKIILQEEEETIVDNLKVANVFNDHFCDIALNIGFDESITPSCDAIAKHVKSKICTKYAMIPSTLRVLMLVLLTRNCVTLIKKSQGYDDIPGKLLRLAHSALAPHLTYLLNECLRTSAFLYNMKNAELSPVYKRHSISCTKAARQLNAFARISRYLNISSRSLLYSSFVRSNLNYCAMVWHFCGKTNNNKIEKIQERALRISHRNYESSYEDLLSATEVPTMLTRHIRVILNQ